MPKRDKWHFLTTQVGYDKYRVPIYEAAARNKCVPLLKTLMSNSCSNNCKFCAFRAERRTRRERWKPEELAKVTMKVWKENKIRGLFLSSSVERDPDEAVRQEIETIRILRNIGFTAYTHCRIMPGVDIDLIKQSVQLADRVGINIEFPRAEHYDDMKIHLDFRQDVIKRLKFLGREVIKAQKDGRCRAGLDSQMIVGASNETDKEILKVADWLYNELKARRVYFSSFEPIERTPLENKPAENKWREHRLYQSSFLIQKYGFREGDFILDDSNMLPLNCDPKFLFAKKYELHVDVNAATFNDLIKVPGIGLKTAERIIVARNAGTKLKNEKDLKKIGVVVQRALPFVKVGSVQKTLNEWIPF